MVCCYISIADGSNGYPFLDVYEVRRWSRTSSSLGELLRDASDSVSLADLQIVAIFEAMFSSYSSALSKDCWFEQFPG